MPASSGQPLPGSGFVGIDDDRVGMLDVADRGCERAVLPAAARTCDSSGQSAVGNVGRRILAERLGPAARQLAQPRERLDAERILHPQRMPRVPENVIRRARRRPREPRRLGHVQELQRAFADLPGEFGEGFDHVTIREFESRTARQFPAAIFRQIRERGNECIRVVDAESGEQAEFVIQAATPDCRCVRAGVAFAGTSPGRW